MNKVSIAAKELAYLIYASGDLSNEFFYNHDENEGKKAHIYLQKKYTNGCEKEVYVSKAFLYNEYEITINGFIDGILVENNKIIIEEIKSTKLNLDEITIDYHEEYLAQLKIYMAMYLIVNDLFELSGRLTFINIDSYETKSFEQNYTRLELIDFINETLSKYVSWIKITEDYYEQRDASIAKLRFLYKSFRTGQKDFMKACYYVQNNQGILFGVAPTGIGKTVSTLYPSIRLLSKTRNKIFYLTPKNSQKELAINTVSEMIKNGLVVRLIEITSKEKICFFKKEICDAEDCKFAKSFFKNVRLAMKDILSHELIFNKLSIEEYALKYEVCPFEFSLNLSNFSDIVVCDYNYVFDPLIKLHRYFDEAKTKINILVDEAHNLIDRSREMYSDEFVFSKLISLRKMLRGKKPTINSRVASIKKELESFDDDFSSERIIFTETPKKIVSDLYSIRDKIKQVLSDATYKKDFKNYHDVLHLYLDLELFLKRLEFYGSYHRFIIEKLKDDYNLKFYCLDAKNYLASTLDILNSSIFFSATLTPLDYYKNLISMNKGEHIVLPSPFPKENLDLILIDNVKTFYSSREKSIDKIVDLIEITMNEKRGNYIIFFPSYQYMHLVKKKICEREYDFEVIFQTQNQTSEEREYIIERFNDTTNSKFGFFVLGGVFSEGIDFIGDKLNGVIIIGVGLPQINYINEMIKNHFELEFNEGNDYAYIYPGYNKVLQAAGRVIRSEKDKGIVVIVDPRITSAKYISLFPSHWQNYKKIYRNIDYKNELKRFWNN